MVGKRDSKNIASKLAKRFCNASWATHAVLLGRTTKKPFKSRVVGCRIGTETLGHEILGFMPGRLCLRGSKIFFPVGQLGCFSTIARTRSVHLGHLSASNNHSHHWNKSLIVLGSFLFITMLLFGKNSSYNSRAIGRPIRRKTSEKNAQIVIAYVDDTGGGTPPRRIRFQQLIVHWHARSAQTVLQPVGISKIG